MLISINHPARRTGIRRITFVCAFAFLLTALTHNAIAEDWPQFRGPGGRAVSETATPPIGFGPSSNLVWQVALPEGYSSPIVTGQRVFLTAVQDGKLETLGLDRKDGRILWRKPAVSDNRKFEAPNPPTPVTDGKSVFVFFGPVGVIAYDLDGREQWRRPIAQPDLQGSASPILIDDKLIIVSDRGEGSYVEALDQQTGRLIWHVERPQFLRCRATPFHWVHDKTDELIVAGSFRLTSYDPRTGAENWHYTGTARFATSSPAAAENLLFTASSNIGPNEDDGGKYTGGLGSPFAEFGGLPTPAEGVEKVLLAIRSGGSGDISQSHLAWKSTRGLPYASSPLFYKGRLFTVKDGGLASAYNVATGQPIYQDERIAPGNYWASAVAAAGRVYFSAQNGNVSVIDAASDHLVVLAQNKLDGEILATPALVGQTIYFRTTSNLFAFGNPR